jgi:NADH-quinone oxidoreductase subunit J
MNTLFYAAAAIAVAATLMTITRLHAVHALLYLAVSLLAVAVVFYIIGAPFVAALEVIIYAGAIMVLFIFVVMMLNLGNRAVEIEKAWLKPGMWIGPSILAAALIGELFYLLSREPGPKLGAAMVEPKQVGIALFGPYLIGVELASILLMGGLVGAFHLGWRKRERKEAGSGVSSFGARVDARGDLVRAGDDRGSGST